MSETQATHSSDHAAREIDKYLTAAWKNNASDVHIKVGEPPLYRIRGTIVRAKLPPFTYDQVTTMFQEAMGPRQLAELEELGGTDYAYSIKGVGRFRINIFKQRGSL